MSKKWIVRKKAQFVPFFNDPTFLPYNENTKNRKAAQEIDINSGKSKTIQYELSSSDQDIYNSDDYIELQALFEYDGRYYILAVGEDFAGFVGYDQ